MWLNSLIEVRSIISSTLAPLVLRCIGLAGCCLRNLGFCFGRLTLLVATLMMSVLLTSCTRSFLDSVQKYQYGPYHHRFFQPQHYAMDPVSPQKLRVVGYGSMSSNKQQSMAQRRLIAMRASRLDAYRSLAERVYGLTIEGTTTVNDMIVENDQFKSFVEASLHGARVVSTDVMDDGSVQTVVEMIIDHGFRNCLETAGQARFNIDCRIPLGGRQLLPTQYFPEASPSPSASNPSTSNPMVNQHSGFYQIE